YREDPDISTGEREEILIRTIEIFEPSQSFDTTERPRGECGLQRRHIDIGGEDRNPLAWMIGPGLALGQRDDAACDPRSTIDEGERARRYGGEVIGDQRKVRAGQHHRVDRVAARLVEQAGEDIAIILR